MPHKQMGHIVRKYVLEKKRVKGAALLLTLKQAIFLLINYYYSGFSTQ